MPVQDAIQLLNATIKTAYPYISEADMYTLAGATAIEAMGGSESET
jgi:catalase (peroxidase I)